MQNLEILRVQPGDEKTWQDAVAALVAEEDRGHALVSLDDLSAAIRDSRCYLLLAVLDWQAIGLLSAYSFPDLEAGGRIVYLYDIEVDTQYRKQGVGSSLVTRLTELCREDGVSLIWAGTERNNAAARRMFEVTGAVLEGDQYVEYEWTLE